MFSHICSSAGRVSAPGKGGGRGGGRGAASLPGCPNAAAYILDYCSEIFEFMVVVVVVDGGVVKA